MRRNAGRNDNHLIKTEPVSRRHGKAGVSDMRRVKCSAKDADFNINLSLFNVDLSVHQLRRAPEESRRADNIENSARKSEGQTQRRFHC